MKRVEANDDGAMVMLASCYHVGCEDLQQDRAKAMELFVRAAEMVSSMAHFTLGSIYREGGFEEGQEFTILPANQCDEKHIIHFLCWRVRYHYSFLLLPHDAIHHRAGSSTALASVTSHSTVVPGNAAIIPPETLC